MLTEKLIGRPAAKILSNHLVDDEELHQVVTGTFVDGGIGSEVASLLPGMGSKRSQPVFVGITDRRVIFLLKYSRSSRWSEVSVPPVECSVLHAGGGRMTSSVLNVSFGLEKLRLYITGRKNGALLGEAIERFTGGPS
jgi:hypothetical protein